MELGFKYKRNLKKPILLNKVDSQFITSTKKYFT